MDEKGSDPFFPKNKSDLIIQVAFYLNLIFY